MNEIKQSAQNREGNITKSVFWGTITLGVIALLVFGYFTVFFLRQDKTPVIYIATAIFLFTFLVALTSLGLTIRGQQKLGAELVLYILSLLGVSMASVLQGRTPTASLSILTLSIIAILYLLPHQSRRWYLSVTAVSFIMMWVIEWLNPPWRIQVAAATVGPAAVIVFGVILIALAASQAWSGNIRIKIITAFTIVALTSLGILGTVTYINYRNQVREDIRQRLLNIASITATQLDGDLHATLQTSEDMQTEAYWQMMAQGDEIVATDPSLTYAYTMRMNDQGQIYFIIDSRQANDTERVDIGTIYEEPSETLLSYFKTPDRPFVEQEIVTDEYGSFLSAYAPFYRADGSLEGIFGVDIAADKVIAAEQAVLRLTLITTAIAMVLVTLLGLFLGNVFTNPIIHLSQVAQKITAGDLNARAAIETTDEVGELAITLNAMTSQLQGTLQGLEQRVAERTRNLELAAEVAHAVSQVRELGIMLKDACDLIWKEFNLYYVQVYLTDANGSTLNLKAGTGTVGSQLLGRNHSLPLDTSSINGRAAVEKRPVVISDTTQNATFRPNPLLPDTRSEMAVPLIIGDKVVGVLDMQSDHPDVLTKDILTAFEALAGQIAVAIQNANLLAETEQARAQVEAQARRLVRTGWGEHLDAIHKPEQLGFVFEHNQISPLRETETTNLAEQGKAVDAPISITGEMLGSLVVEIDGESRREQTSDLLHVVARQVSQQIENLRLLESAERYRYESEKTARRQTVKGWQDYMATRNTESLGFVYDTNEVRPLGNGKDEDNLKFTLPLKIRDEVIGKLAIQGIEADDSEAFEITNAIAERLSLHIENLRQFDETRRGQIELDKRAQQLAAVAEVSTVSSKELDIQKMLESVVFLTQRKFGLYHAHVFLYNENTDELAIAACGWQEGDEHEGTHGTAVIPLQQEQSLVARAARTRTAVIVNDVHNEPGWLPNPLLPDTASELAVPLVIGDRILGVLDVQSDKLNAFTEEDANIQTTLASQVATALQNARSFKQAQKQAERETMLNVINQKIQSATSVESVLQIAARELGHALGAPMTIAQLSMKDTSK